MRKIHIHHRSQHHGFLRIRYILLILLIILGIWQIFRILYKSGKYFKLGQEFYSQGKIDEAIENWERASRLNPWSAKTFVNLADAYNRKALYTKSYDSARRAVELRPDYENALVTFAESCFRLAGNEKERRNCLDARKFYRECVIACKKALKLAQGPDVMHFLCRAYSSLGEYDEGIIFLKETVPGNRYAEKEIDLLMEAKRDFLKGAGPNLIVESDTEGPLPRTAEVAMRGHPVLEFSDEERRNFQNGIFYSDLDMDGKKELVLIYKIPRGDNKNSFFVSVFKRGEKRWDLRWNAKISDYDVGYFTVEDITGDSKPEILVEAIYDTQSGALVNIYAWEGSFYRSIQQFGPTWGTTLMDVDGNGTKEIILLDRKRKELNSVLYRWCITKYIKTEE